MNELSEYLEQCRPPNLLTPIFQVNDDILLYIFFINSQVPPINFHHDTYKTKPLQTTIATSQVSHWRLLCLSTSTLWSNINFVKMSSKWREELLRRASSSPIALRYYKTNNSSLKPLIQRLRDIHEQDSRVSIRSRTNSLAPPLYPCFGLLFAPGAVLSSITTLQLTIFEPYNHPFPFEMFHNINALFVGLDTLAIILPIIGESGLLFPSLKTLGLIVSNESLQLDSVISFLSWRRERDAQINTLELHYLSRDESWTSFVTIAQRRKLELLEVELALFFVVDERSLVRTEIVELPVGSHDDEVHKLKCLWDCW